MIDSSKKIKDNEGEIVYKNEFMFPKVERCIDETKMTFKKFIGVNETLVISYEVDSYLESMGFDFILSGGALRKYYKTIYRNGSIILITFTSEMGIYIQRLGKNPSNRVNVFRQYRDVISTQAKITVELLDSDEFMRMFITELDLLSNEEYYNDCENTIVDYNENLDELLENHNIKVRSSYSVANTIRTLCINIHKMRTDNDTELEKELRRLKINIRKENDETQYKGMDDIIMSVKKIWSEMSKKDRLNLANLMVGCQGTPNLFAIMEYKN